MTASIHVFGDASGMRRVWFTCPLFSHDTFLAFSDCFVPGGLLKSPPYLAMTVVSESLSLSIEIFLGRQAWDCTWVLRRILGHLFT